MFDFITGFEVTKENEPQFRMAAFFSIFLIMALFEILTPRRPRTEVDGQPVKGRRWLSHAGIVIVDSLAVRVIFPAAAVGTALYAAEHQLGLFNAINMPIWLAGIIAFIILDFAVWLEHWASHKFPILWRIHRMHHSDPDLDLTTALRFHPLEIILSMVWKALIIVALGAPVAAVLLFEIVLNGMAMFNHANVKLPLSVDRILRWVFVTPDMHRVHHSIHNHETDSNYGFNLSIWDRLFRTYIHDPQDGQEGMIIGLKEYRDEKPMRFSWLLIVPFLPLINQNDSKKSTGK